MQRRERKSDAARERPLIEKKDRNTRQSLADAGAILCPESCALLPGDATREVAKGGWKRKRAETDAGALRLFSGRAKAWGAGDVPIGLKLYVERG